MPRITISYRRDDSGVITGRIFDRLAAHYGRDAVFRDIDSIPPGADFRDHISHVLDESDILLAIVGPRWLGTRGAQTRLDDDADPVRVEIETGLRKQMPVIPVLVQRAAMPRAAQLPDPVKDFAYRHAVQVDAGQDFDVHAARLIRAMDRILQQKQGNTPVRVSDLTGEDALSAVVADAGTPETAVPTGPGIAGTPALAATGGDRVLGRVPLAPRDAVTVVPPERRRSGGLVLVLGTGAILGAVAAAAIAVWLAPSIPPDIAALATAKQAADSHALSLQAELAGTQKKLATAQDALDAAQKQAADQAKRLTELQAGADQSAKELAAQKDADAQAQAQLDQAAKELAAQTDAATKAQAQLDQSAKELAAQKDAAAKAQTQLDRSAKELAAQRDLAAKAQALLDQSAKELAAQADTAAKAQARADDLQGQLKAIGDQLASEKKARQDALDLIAQLNGKIKLLEEQASASPTAPQPVPETPTATATPPADDSTWSTDQRREAQSDLITLGHLKSSADGNFGPATRTAIKQFQAFLGDPETGVMSDAERTQSHDMAQQLAALLARGETSPDGVAASTAKGTAQRYQRAWTAEKGSNKGAPDSAEAIYWYGLAAVDGDGKALANLGTLLVRGQGVAKPDPDGAALLWWAAAARGEATAMFNLGALWEHGIGVAADPAKAKAWYQRAAAKGDPGSQIALKRLGV